MSQYYHFPHDGQGASDLVNAGNGNGNNNNNHNQVLPPTDFGRGHELPTSQFLPNVNYPLSFVPEEEPPASAPKNTGQARRRLPPGTDHVKHRRTRSGCYTCRSRRVKVSPPASLGRLYIHSSSRLVSVMKHAPSASVRIHFESDAWP